MLGTHKNPLRNYVYGKIRAHTKIEVIRKEFNENSDEFAYELENVVARRIYQFEG